jgi:MFS family permease
MRSRTIKELRDDFSASPVLQFGFCAPIAQSDGEINMLNRTRAIYNEYPRPFWTLMIGSFIDQLGGALLFPFFSLYITFRFDVGVTEVGIVFAIFSLSSFGGNALGGAMADKFGRKAMFIFGLVTSALSSLAMGFVDDLFLFYALAAIVGLLSSAGGPATGAMIADLLPEEKRADGYGLHRVVFNLAVTIGPAIGGFLATRSYLLLFILDAVTSIITAVIAYFLLPETKPEARQGQEEQSLAQSMGGYGDVFRDRIFMTFIGIAVLMVLVYMQMNSTLAVYLRDTHGFSTQQFGWLMTLNAGMVVLFQFWITRRLAKRQPLIMMAVGTLFYALGFSMYGYIAGVYVFQFAILAMVIITIGEMIVSPFQQALVAKFAPEDMRGRYMAVHGLSWGIPSAFGPLAAGLVMDNYDPRLVWYSAGVIGLLAAVGYAWLNARARERLAEEPAQYEETSIAGA